MAKSLQFYKAFGFEPVEGDPVDGWVVVVDEGGARLGLFSQGFMGADMFSLNFRDGNLRAIEKAAASAGLTFEHGPRFVGEHGGSATIRDPDGHLLFFDSAASL